MIFKKPKRIVNKVYIHCSDSNIASHDNIATITKWHTDPKPPPGEKLKPGYGKGWKWVGYHFFIRQDGTIEEGRDLEEQPAAQGKYKGKYYNKGSIAICLSGGRHKDLNSFTQKQFDSLRGLCVDINKSYDKVTFHGHCEVSSKPCPVFDYKSILYLDDKGYMQMPISTIINNLSIKSKKKMVLSLGIAGAISLAKLATPFIKKLAIKGFDRLKGKALEKAKETVIKKILQKTGIDLGDVREDELHLHAEQINQAMDKLSPEQLLELKKEIIESESELLKSELENQTEQMAIVNRTMRQEMKSDNWIVAFWRPLNGIFFGVSMFFLIVGSISLNAYAVFTSNSEISNMVSIVNQSLMAAMSLWAVVVGGHTIGRSFEKIQKLKRL